MTSPEQTLSTVVNKSAAILVDHVRQQTLVKNARCRRVSGRKTIMTAVIEAERWMEKLVGRIGGRNGETFLSYCNVYVDIRSKDPKKCSAYVNNLMLPYLQDNPVLQKIGWSKIVTRIETLRGASRWANFVRETFNRIRQQRIAAVGPSSSVFSRFMATCGGMADRCCGRPADGFFGTGSSADQSNSIDFDDDGGSQSSEAIAK